MSGGATDASPDRVAGLVLAAGASRRLGEPKQLARLGGEMLLERAVRVATQAGFSPLLVVLGSEADRVLATANLRGAEIVLNPEWAEGMGSSLRAGMTALAARPGVSGVVVTTCDMPQVTASHLRALAGGGSAALASAYAGRTGVPAYLPRSRFAEALEIRGDVGARVLLAGARTIPLAHGELDVDTPEQLEQARALLRRRV